MKKTVYRLTMSLDAYDYKLLEEASKIVCGSHLGDPQLTRRDHRRVVLLALLAYARAVITRGKCPGLQGPEVAVLRDETREELEARMQGELPGGSNVGWKMPNRWN